IRTAISHGANGFTFTVHPTNLQVLKELIATRSLPSDFAVYPTLPYVAGYLRTMNEKGIVGTLGELFNEVSIVDRAKLVIEGGVTSLAGDPIGLMKKYLNYELSRIPREANIAGVLLHDVVTDLAVSYRSADVIQSHIESVRDKWHATPGFVTRNFSKFIEFFNQLEWRLSDVLIMTPFNRIGFQMNPSKESCEVALSKLDDGTVIAMSIMAGGYLRLNEAISYIYSLPNLFGVTVGVSSEDHARDTFAKLRSMTQTPS
ncbi:MAG: hypothetical protein WB643_06340, partial [Candidatus Bathyarchaeia archaeon]